MAGLTPTGLEIKRLADVIADLNAAAVAQFQDLVPEGDAVNTDPNSILGRQIGLYAAGMAEIWEALEQVYNSENINAATGIALDNLAALGGVERKAATSTLTGVKLTGSVGTAIPQGSQIGSIANNETNSLIETVVLDASSAFSATFSVLTLANSTAYSISYQPSPDSGGIGLQTLTITSDSDATASEILTALASAINTAPHNTRLIATVNGTKILVKGVDNSFKFDFSNSANLLLGEVEKFSTVRCDTTGPIEQPANTLTKILVPILGWTAVTNPTSGILGNDRETDDELRQRYVIAKFGDGQNLIESLYSALYAMEDVTSVVIIENDTDTTLTLPNPPVPPHSFYVVLIGGDTDDIARTIWDNKPAGILSYGDITTTVYDSQGIGHPVSFNRPTAKDIYVTVNITVQEDFAPDGVNQIKTAVANYINGLLIGEDVIYSRLYTPINSVVGHYVDSLYIDDSSAPAAQINIPINFDEKASITLDNILVVT